MLSCRIGLVPPDSYTDKSRPSDSAPRRSPRPSSPSPPVTPSPSSILHFKGKIVHAAVHAPARCWVISSRPLRLPLVLLPFSVEGPVDKYWTLHAHTYTISVPFVSVSRFLRPWRANDVYCVVPIAIQDQRKTYASFLFANEAALSLGFFCPAALFCAFWRSCSL